MHSFRNHVSGWMSRSGLNRRRPRVASPPTLSSTAESSALSGLHVDKKLRTSSPRPDSHFDLLASFPPLPRLVRSPKPTLMSNSPDLIDRMPANVQFQAQEQPLPP